MATTSKNSGSSDKLTIAIIALSVLTILILVMVIVVAFKDPSDKRDLADSNSSAEHDVTKEPSDTPEEKPEDASVYNFRVEPIQASIDLETGNTLDWVVTGGTPTTKSLKRKSPVTEEYISNFRQHGGPFKEALKPNHVIKYEAGKTRAYSTAVTTMDMMKAPGKGWAVDIIIPNQHKGPLLITFYVINEKINYVVNVTTSQNVKAFKFPVPSNESTRCKISCRIANPVAGKSYSFEFLATGKTGDAFGLSGIQVSKP